MKTFGFALLVVLAIACSSDGSGSSSGVDQSKPITTLETSEVEDFCDWMIDLYGGEAVEHECPDNVTVTTPTRAECVADYEQINANCSGVTVGEMEACIEALAEDPCNFGGQACAEFLECSFG